ncbi:F-box associated domain containing protein [Tanacetum coccineum]
MKYFCHDVGHLGFGYDELSHDYKVVITAIEPKMSTIIYSFKTGKWKEIGHFPCARPLDAGKLLNGVLHWVACKSTSSDSFKIVVKFCNRSIVKVYGVKDSWTKLASIPYPHFRWAQTLDPFCILEDGKMLLQFGSQLLVYDSKDGSSSTIDKVCIDACIVVESLVSPFPPLGLADNNDDED